VLQRRHHLGARQHRGSDQPVGLRDRIAGELWGSWTEKLRS
jgi:hypothetical protein